MVESPDGDASPGVQAGKTPLQTAVEEFLADKGDGNTHRHYRRVLLASAERTPFVEWATSGGVDSLEAIDSEVCRSWAKYLNRRVHGDGITGSTAHSYYDCLSAFLAWAVRRELVPSNPARSENATEALPEDRGSGRQQQFWTAEAREQLLKYVEERAHASLDADDRERERAFRDRALAYVLALTGARGAEVFRDTNDRSRAGLHWRDVDLEAGTARVLGKSREFETIPLPDRVTSALQRLRRLQDPPSSDWPVFPTQHGPTLAQLDEDEPPPSITVGGARGVMQSLSEAAGVDVDGDYLKPHGARRGLGGTLYRRNPAYAQKFLRHDSLETTDDTYEDIQAGEVAEHIDEVLEEASERGDLS